MQLGDVITEAGPEEDFMHFECMVLLRVEINGVVTASAVAEAIQCGLFLDFGA